jgi:hypothetical protein
MHPSEAMCSEYFMQILKPIHDTGARAWIAGGAVRDWYVHRKVLSDVDVWFPSKEDMDRAAQGVAWKPTKDTNASINYRVDGKWWVQLVKKHFFSDMEATIAAFDFTVCCAATDGKSLITHPHFFIDLALKRLAFNTIPFPVSTWKRCAKYMEKGFKLCPDEQNKLLIALKGELADLTVEQANERYME